MEKIELFKKVKDLSKVKLNKDDVLLEMQVEVKKGTGLDLSAMNKKEREELTEKLIHTKILAKGSNVDEFEVGDYTFMKGGNRYAYELRDKVDSLEWRIVTIHKNNIEYSVNPYNYEL